MNKPEEFPDQGGIAVVVVCEGGNVYVNAGGKVIIKDSDGKTMENPKAFETESIFDNFISAVRSRKREEQYADCEETHISSALCHTGLISHQLGSLLHDGEIRERIKDDAVLTDRYAAMEEHLGQNGVNLTEETITLGPLLKFNPNSERYEGNGDLDQKANMLAKREYRKPYEVTEVS